MASYLDEINNSGDAVSKRNLSLIDGPNLSKVSINNIEIVDVLIEKKKREFFCKKCEEIISFFLSDDEYELKVKEFEANPKHDGVCGGFIVPLTRELKKELERKKKEREWKEIAEQLILEEGKAMRYILDTANLFHCGDETEIEAIYLSVLCIKIRNSNGIHYDLVGKQGTGKSHMQRTVAYLFSPDMIIQGSLSPKALFYLDLKDGLVIFMDDIELTDEIRAIVKRCTTAFHERMTHRTITEKGVGKQLGTPAEMVFWVNFNFGTVDDAFNSRFMNHNINESEERKNKIHEFMVEKNKQGLPDFYLNDKVEICRMIYEILPRLFVKIPFEIEKYNEIQKDISFRDKTLIDDFIRCNCLLNYKNRELQDKSIIANEKDFDNVKRIWHHFFKSSEGKKDDLSKLERDIYELLFKYNGGLYQGEIAFKLGKERRNITKALSNLLEKRSDFEKQKETIQEDDGTGTGFRKSVHKTRYFIRHN